MLNSQRVQDRSRGKWGNPHNPYHFDIMWGFSSCAGLCWQHHGNHSIDWPMSPTVHSSGLVMWDIGFLLASLAPSWCVLAVVSRVPGRRVLHLVLDDFEGQHVERDRDDCDKTLRGSETGPVLSSPNSFIKHVMKLLIFVIEVIDSVPFLYKKKVSLHSNLKSKSLALFDVTD